VVSQPIVMVAPTQASVQAHTQIAEQIKHAPVPLKHTEVAHDASQPKVEAVHIKPNPHPAVMVEVGKPQALKHTEVSHDASKPQISTEVKLQKNDRANLFTEIKASPAAVSSGENSVVKSFDDAMRGAETSMRMIDATKKTVASNEKNLEDSKNNAHGCDPVPEAEKKLASSKDLLLAHTETAQRKLKTVAYCFDNAKRVLNESHKERYNKLLANAKVHGL